MKRIITVVPDAGTAKELVEIFHASKIPEKNIYVVAKPDNELVVHDPDIEVAESAVGTLLSGVTLGAIGHLASLPVFVMAGGALVATGATLGAAVLGAGLVDWLASLFSRSKDDKKIQDLAASVSQNKILVIVDVPENKIDKIKEELKKRRLEIKVEKEK